MFYLFLSFLSIYFIFFYFRLIKIWPIFSILGYLNAFCCLFVAKLPLTFAKLNSIPLNRARGPLNDRCSSTRSLSTTVRCWRTLPPSTPWEFGRPLSMPFLVDGCWWSIHPGGRPASFHHYGVGLTPVCTTWKSPGTTSQWTRTGHPRWAASRARCQTQSQLLLWRQWIFLKSGRWSLQEVGVMVPRKSRTTRTWRSSTSPARAA